MVRSSHPSVFGQGPRPQISRPPKWARADAGSRRQLARGDPDGCRPRLAEGGPPGGWRSCSWSTRSRDQAGSLGRDLVGLGYGRPRGICLLSDESGGEELAEPPAPVACRGRAAVSCAVSGPCGEHWERDVVAGWSLVWAAAHRADWGASAARRSGEVGWKGGPGPGPTGGGHIAGRLGNR